MAEAIKVFAICGSLRKGSYNRMALKVAAENLPPSMTLDQYDRLAEIPPYNEDVRQQGFPPVIEDLRRRIKAADGLLFVTPEYNYSVPGVLKNAIDWASRPPDQPFAGKPVAMMGASMGGFGAGRAQYHLRQTCVYLDMVPLNKPEVMIPQAHDKFDAQGHLKDAASLKFIQDLMVALAAWTRRLKA